MQNPDSIGSVNGNFSDGDPKLGLKPTHVLAKWFNSVNKEIANVILAAGIDLVPAGTEESDEDFETDQLLKAVKTIAGSTFLSCSIENNAAVDTAFMNGPDELFIFDSSKTTSFEISYEAYRKSVDTETIAIGKIAYAYLPSADKYVRLKRDQNQHSEIGLDFPEELEKIEETTNFILKYKTNEFTGGSYVGRFKYNLYKFD
ncbi:hypothetical protein HBN50_07845 [Halobacteriovorax sp. GB3]|uniref:hypothetical protein n=1 Tax=Halobacteriovorax sp. GB3 TaxID=2719615 RepID=UPI0023619F58|nr:hypothetical protein [Halobacteriovorax sp. GB3]MDD0853004.1 hypothetical protein [Halobacteriovorax sp. GB3]